MDARIINIILSTLTGLSFVWAYFSEENRIIGIILGFILIILIIISERNEDLASLKEDVRKLKDKLNIHEQLIEIKKNIELLKQRGNKK